MHIECYVKEGKEEGRRIKIFNYKAKNYLLHSMDHFLDSSLDDGCPVLTHKP